MPEFLKALGIVCWLGAAYFVAEAMHLDVEVDVPAEAAALIGTATVANAHLMHIQLLGFLSGAFLSVNGSILIVGGLLMGRRKAQ